MTMSSWRGREVPLAAALTAAVVAVRVGLGMQAASCGTPDACAYLGLGQALARGDGFRTPYLFDLQVDKLAVPTHGIEYWRPGTSFFLLLAKLFGGLTLHGSIVVTVLAGVGLAAAAWWMAMRATGSRGVALGAYGLCLVLPPLWGSSLTPDSTLFYALAVAWFLALMTVRRQGVAEDVAALLLAGVAYMVRNDAAVVLGAPLLAVLWRRWRAQDASGTYVALLLAGFVLAMTPVHWMNWKVLGTAFPPGVGKALFLNDLSDFVRYREPVGLHRLLVTGVGHLVKVRAVTLALVVYRNLALGVGFAMVFLPALWMERGRESRNEALPELTGAGVFLAAMLTLYVLVLPAIGIFSALRSFVALLPLVAVLVVVAVVRMARDGRVAAALVAGVIVVYAVSGAMEDRRALDGLAEQGAALRVLAAGLEAAGAQRSNAVVMTADPVQFAVATGFTAVTMPKNGAAAVKGIADEVGVTHVLVDGAQPAESLREVEAALRPERVVKMASSPELVLVLRH